MIKGWKHLRFWDSPAHDWICNNWFKICHPAKILPHIDNWYAALELTSFKDTKVVILGQDPYHTKGMAHGLAFSVLPHNKTLPPSLKNILREYQDDLDLPAPRTGDLRAWASEGVLLLNTIFTVEEGKALSHKGIGWEKLTYEIIRSLATRGNCVFVLWGKHAQEYAGGCADCPIIRSSHPSPLAVRREREVVNFRGSKPFTRTNEELVKLGLTPINWKLS
jgi:uracil-DNA glycosylase